MYLIFIHRKIRKSGKKEAIIESGFSATTIIHKQSDSSNPALKECLLPYPLVFLSRPPPDVRRVENGYTPVYLRTNKKNSINISLDYLSPLFLPTLCL